MVNVVVPLVFGRAVKGRRWLDPRVHVDRVGTKQAPWTVLRTDRETLAKVRLRHAAWQPVVAPLPASMAHAAQRLPGTWLQYVARLFGVVAATPTSHTVSFSLRSLLRQVDGGRLHRWWAKLQQQVTGHRQQTGKIRGLPAGARVPRPRGFRLLGRPVCPNLSQAQAAKTVFLLLVVQMLEHQRVVELPAVARRFLCEPTLFDLECKHWVVFGVPETDTAPLALEVYGFSDKAVDNVVAAVQLHVRQMQRHTRQVYVGAWRDAVRHSLRGDVVWVELAGGAADGCLFDVHASSAAAMEQAAATVTTDLPAGVHLAPPVEIVEVLMAGDTARGQARLQEELARACVQSAGARLLDMPYWPLHDGVYVVEGTAAVQKRLAAIPAARVEVPAQHRGAVALLLPTISLLNVEVTLDNRFPETGTVYVYGQHGAPIGPTVEALITGELGEVWGPQLPPAPPATLLPTPPPVPPPPVTTPIVAPAAAWFPGPPLPRASSQQGCSVGV